jgi:hypothetical protein
MQGSFPLTARQFFRLNSQHLLPCFSCKCIGRPWPEAAVAGAAPGLEEAGSRPVTAMASAGAPSSIFSDGLLMIVDDVGGGEGRRWMDEMRDKERTQEL